MAIKMENSRISVFNFDFFEKRIQIPIKPKTIKTDKKVNWRFKLVVICSATESVNGSVVVRNGLIALRYRNDGDPIKPELNKLTPETTRETRRIMQFLIFVDSLL